MYKEVEGDLIKLALTGQFDVVLNECNCFCIAVSGLSPDMATTFGCLGFQLEGTNHKGDYLKLGRIDYKFIRGVNVVNCYTQFMYSTTNLGNLDYTALAMCLQKVNYIFKGKKIGLPEIGKWATDSDWLTVKYLIESLLVDCDVTVVKQKA